MEDIFTTRFREAIEQSGMSQQALADKTHLSKQCISDFKIGKAFPSLQTLRILCTALEVSADYLIGIESDDGNKPFL